MRLPAYKYYLASIDFCIAVLSFFEARYIVLMTGRSFPLLGYYNLFGVSYSFLFSSFLFSFLLILIFQNNELYKLNVFLTRSSQLASIIKSIAYELILLIIGSFFFKISYIIDSRALVLAFAFTSLLNFSLVRVIIARSFYRKYSNIKPILRNTVIVGAGVSGKILATKLNFEETLGLKLIGFVDDHLGKDSIILSGIKVIGNTEELDYITKMYNVDEFIISIDEISYEDLLKIIDKCNRTTAIVKLNSRLFQIIHEKISTEIYSGIPVIEVSERVNKKWHFVLKRISDLILASFGIVLLLPLFLILAIIIKISSKGPVLFMQERIGKNGKPFMFYKFRSMEIGSENDIKRKKEMIHFIKNQKKESEGKKIINESRITWIGKFIRKTSIDELPQLLNVLKGEMSLVGPRPCLEYEWESFDTWQRRRAAVLPGCTGIWQVSGRSNVSFNDSVIMDIYYINNMSPWLDLQIIIKTFPVMLFSHGGK